MVLNLGIAHFKVTAAPLPDPRDGRDDTIKNPNAVSVHVCHGRAPGVPTAVLAVSKAGAEYSLSSPSPLFPIFIARLRSHGSLIIKWEPYLETCGGNLFPLLGCRGCFTYIQSGSDLYDSGELISNWYRVAQVVVENLLLT